MFAACATPSAVSNPELKELTAEVRALREENQRLEQRLDRVELRTAVSVRPEGEVHAAATAAAQRPVDAIPSLTVVKLKPRQQAAPKISTGVEVAEPPPEVFDNLKAAAGTAAEPPPDEEDKDVGDAVFEHAMSALKTGNVEGGIAELQKFASQSPRHPRADNALYFAGLGLMGLNDYEDAARAFDEVVGRYPAGDVIIDAMLKLAECRLRLNKPSDARSVYQKIVANYPGTSAATTAQSRLSSLTASP